MNILESNVEFRQATVEDVPAIMRSRGADPEWGPADPRTAAYLDGTHHPQRALAPRVLHIALDGQNVVGYIAGHLTLRYDCDGELQYLWVAAQYRRHGVAAKLFGMLAQWFDDQGAKQICVDVEPDNLVARSFYYQQGAIDLNSHWLTWPNIASALCSARARKS